MWPPIVPATTRAEDQQEDEKQDNQVHWCRPGISSDMVMNTAPNASQLMGGTETLAAASKKQIKAMASRIVIIMANPL